MRAILVLLFLLTTHAASAQDRTTPIALGAYMTMGYWDAAGTAFCAGQGTCHEVNPLLAPIVERRGIVPAMTVKGAQLAVNIGNTRRLARDQ